MKCTCEFQIESVRKQLIDVAEQEGLHSERTIELSCQLDMLINEYEKQKKEKKFKLICDSCL